jgi:predicted site-specific integrase-resolvase
VVKQDREAIRILVQDLGYQEASRRTGIAYGTLRQWANRGKWNKPIAHSQAVTTVTNPIAEAHAEALAEAEAETRMSLARSAQRLAKKAERTTLRNSQNVKNIAQTAAIVYRWGEEKGKGNFTLNVLNMGNLDVSVDPVRSSASEES